MNKFKMLVSALALALLGALQSAQAVTTDFSSVTDKITAEVEAAGPVILGVVGAAVIIWAVMYVPKLIGRGAKSLK